MNKIRNTKANHSVEWVHVIFKTHLDVGFTDFARNVKRAYLERFIPAAIGLARQIRETTSDRFIWTTGSWIIYEFLEWAGPTNRRLMEQAIADGDITWHALPFTSHSEFMGREMFRFGLSLSQTLDRRFGHRTIAAKMTDIPGHTRSIVPLLADAGVKFLHLGVIPVCKLPVVPPAFVWRDDASDTEVLTMYHGNYGQATILPGTRDAIHFAHTGDNHGPQWLGDVVATFCSLKKEYPGAKVAASTLDAYAHRLIAAQPRLPVVTSEIGDTWIYGTASDPQKVAAYRAACRVREQWLAAGRIKSDDRRLANANRLLMMVAEHTWGMNHQVNLADWINYSPAQVAAKRNAHNFQKVEASWNEQRDYIDQSLAALGDHPLAGAVRQEIAAGQPCRPVTKGFRRINAKNVIAAGRFHIRIGQTGAIVGLADRLTGRSLASGTHPLALVIYEMFSAADYRRYLRQYTRDLDRHKGWAITDLTKPGMEATSGGHFQVHPRLVALWRKTVGDSTTLLLKLALPRPICARFGAPREWWLTIVADDDKPALDLDLQWFGKRATRLPEAIWFSFKPKLARPNCWQMDKMGQLISPLETVYGGGRYLHAVGAGIRYAGPDGPLRIDTRDAALVAPGRPALLRCDKQPLNLDQGMHFNLYNNVWGTNFTAWYDDDARFRLRLALT